MSNFVCYTLIDFEDGINLGWINEEYALEYLIRLVKDSIDTKKYNSLQHKSDRVAYLRALSVNSLINDVTDIFMKNEELILNGDKVIGIDNLSTYYDVLLKKQRLKHE